MAQSGYTPIQLYYSTTAAATPTAGNLANGELALNIQDEKLYFKNASGTVKLLASNAASATSGTSILYGNGSGGFSNVTIGSGISFAGGTLSATGSGGTVTSVDVSGGTTGLTTSGGPVTTSGTITLAGTLATTNGGTGLTSFTANGVVYASSTSALTTGSALTFDGTSAQIGDALSGADGSRFYVYANTPASTSYGIKIGGNANSYTQQAIRFYDTYFGAYAGFLGFTTNSLTFGQGTTEGMRLTSTGLGIGTSSPAAKLHIVSTSLPQLRIEYNSSYYTTISNNGTFNIVDASTGNPYTFQRNGSTQMVLDSSGNLGIGTSSPGTRLEVAGDASPIVRLTSTSGPYSQIQSNTVGTLQFMADEGNTGASTSMRFRIDGAEVARFDSSGNLGLGVTPSNAYTGIKSFEFGANGTLMSESPSSVYNATQLGLNFYYDGSGNTKYKSASVAATRYVQYQGTHHWDYAAVNSGSAGASVSFTQAMTLDASGNLVVGGTTAKGFISTVSGSASTTLGALANSNFNAVGAGTVGTFTQICLGAYANTLTYAPAAIGYVATNTTGSNYGDLVFATRGVNTDTAPSERARIDSSGNFGIGLTPVANNGILQLNSYASVQAMMEKATVSATAATGTINFDAATQPVLYYTTNASGNWTINIRGSASLSLNSMMATGQSLTLAFLATNGATAYYQSALTIDGSSVTPKWQGGTAPTAGNASSIDAYVLTVIKTGSATFTVLASQTQFK